MPPYRKIRVQVRRRAARIARSWSQDPGGSNDGVGQSAPSLRLERLPLSPSQALQALLPGYRKLEQWPYSGDRIGPSYFARVYGLGPSGLDYADAWLRENRAEHYEAQELRHWLFALDQLLCDGVDIVNSVGCEGIARRCLLLSNGRTRWEARVRLARSSSSLLSSVRPLPTFACRLPIEPCGGSSLSMHPSQNLRAGPRAFPTPPPLGGRSRGRARRQHVL